LHSLASSHQRGHNGNRNSRTAIVLEEIMGDLAVARQENTNRMSLHVIAVLVQENEGLVVLHGTQLGSNEEDQLVAPQDCLADLVSPIGIADATDADWLQPDLLPQVVVDAVCKDLELRMLLIEVK